MIETGKKWRAESGLIALLCCAAAFGAAICALLPASSGQTQAPLSVLCLIAVLGWGFATRKQARLAKTLRKVSKQISHLENGDLTSRPASMDSDGNTPLELAIDRLRIKISGNNSAQSELLQAHQEARRIAARKSEFLAMMSHEVRTPLNSISGMFELIARADIPERQKLRAEKGKQATTQLFELLSRILDASKIESGRMEPVIEPVHLSDIADFARETLTATQAKGNAAVATTVTLETTLARIATDGILLRQILSNLIDNAVRFTDTGSIHVRIFDAANGHGIAVTVRDTGVGICKSNLTKIFDPFHQIDGKTRRRAGGSGLGLSISKNLADLMGGSLQCTSAPDLGSTFTLLLPPNSNTGEDYALQNIAC